MRPIDRVGLFPRDRRSLFVRFQAAATAGEPSPGSWTQWGGPNQDFRAASSGLAAEWLPAGAVQPAYTDAVAQPRNHRDVVGAQDDPGGAGVGPDLVRRSVALLRGRSDLRVGRAG